MRLHSQGQAHAMTAPILGRLTSVPIAEPDRRGDYIVYATPSDIQAFGGDVGGYAGVFAPQDPIDPKLFALPGIFSAPNLEYLRDGDVVLLLPSGTVNVLYRKSSFHNTILATERCNSLCLMCTQPPKKADDSHRVGEIVRLIELVDPGCREIGISGGEPTLLGADFLKIVRKCKDYLPATALHVLTNGRLFKDKDFAAELGAIGHPDLMLGIPIYSDIDEQHDYVVQAKGAYDETLLGLYNLAASGVRIEIRVVVHALTYSRLPQLANFIYRNLPFASHVALMGMEMFGFVPLNLDVLWIDPVEYQKELEEATLTLALRGMNVSIYNHQLCTIPQSIWPFTKKSISDWKNVYVEACQGCGVQELCGGFFQSATKRHSAHIRPLPMPDGALFDALGQGVCVLPSD